MALRTDILNAIYEAERYHQLYETESRAHEGEGRIDVLGMLVDKDIPVIFRPLRCLLGAYINDPGQGIMITTQRQLPVQRFTAAHEFGHAALGHEASFDEEEILERSPFNNRSSYDTREAQANAFATALLTPQWLIVHHMDRQKWNRKDLTRPVIVYQLSLRMGTSYSATCYALLRYKAITQTTCSKLLGTNKKKIKQHLVKPYNPANWYGDVWIVTEKDNGSILEGSHSDIVVVKVKEHSSSGYIWGFSELEKTGLKIREDDRTVDSGSQVGGVSFRTVIAEASENTQGHILLKEIRPWLEEQYSLNSVEFDLDLSGPVRAGLLPSQRDILLGVL